MVVEIYMYPEYKRNYTIFSAADAKVWEMKKKKKKKKTQVIGKTRLGDLRAQRKITTKLRLISERPW